MHVDVYICVRLYGLVCANVLGHAHVCAHIWSQRTTSGIILRSPPTFSEIRPFSGPELTLNLDWLTGQPQGASVFASPARGLQALHHANRFYAASRV